MSDDGAEYHEHAIAFLCAAVELSYSGAQRGERNRVYSENVFAALGWPAENKKYFADGVLNIVRYLEQRQLIEQVERAYPYEANQLKYSFVPTASAAEWRQQKQDDAKQ